MTSQGSTESFPLPMTGDNEFGDLIEAFNRMVASIEEQRSGLNDTLSLLDSMLANAPIGLAFFDRRCRCVRVNHVFAGIDRCPSQPASRQNPSGTSSAAHRKTDRRRGEAGFRQRGRGARTGDRRSPGANRGVPWTWLVSTYPIRTTLTRCAGRGHRAGHQRAQTERRDVLRKTEKLAATGRLAASIAHEVNNPLEAITNLLYLLRNFCDLDESAMKYVTMAEREGRRIAEIAQQTLRFYRQSTLPHRANMAELLDSVLDLYQGRLNTYSIQRGTAIRSAHGSVLLCGRDSPGLRQFRGKCHRCHQRRRTACGACPPFAKLGSIRNVNGVRFTVADTGIRHGAGCPGAGVRGLLYH